MSNESIFYEKAWEAQGIYPVSIVGGPNAYEKRSEFQEGWNAANNAIIKTVCSFIEFKDSLSNQDQEAFLYLIDKEDIYIYISEDKEDPEKQNVCMAINVNDVFLPGADLEPFQVKDLHLLYWLAKEYDRDGLLAWVTDKTGLIPYSWRKNKSWSSKNDNYTQALEFIKLYKLNNKEEKE